MNLWIILANIIDGAKIELRLNIDLIVYFFCFLNNIIV